MNYQKLYDDIILKGQNAARSKKTGYYEEHHILPKCLGGLNTKDNLVLLTPREHFIVHFVLWKIHKTRKLRDPILFFMGAGIRTSRLYEIARIAHIDEMRNNNPSLHLSEEVKAAKKKKLSAYARNRPAEHNKKISDAKVGTQPRLGAVLTIKSRSQISDSLRRHFATNGVSFETREKLRITSTGKKHTSLAIAKSVQSAKNRVKYHCFKCNDIKEYDGGNIAKHMIGKHSYSKQQVCDEKINWKI